jgi:hypothetical protein
VPHNNGEYLFVSPKIPELTDFLPSKSNILSNYLAKIGDILSRGNMTHFQGSNKHLDFTQLLLMRHAAELHFLPLDMRA